MHLAAKLFFLGKIFQFPSQSHVPTNQSVRSYSFMTKQCHEVTMSAFDKNLKIIVCWELLHGTHHWELWKLAILGVLLRSAWQLLCLLELIIKLQLPLFTGLLIVSRSKRTDCLGT